MLAVGDGVLYGFGFDTPLFALETSEEEVLWRYGGRMTTPPALADDYLFVGSETGTVHAIGPGSK